MFNTRAWPDAVFRHQLRKQRRLILQQLLWRLVFLKQSCTTQTQPTQTHSHTDQATAHVPLSNSTTMSLSSTDVILCAIVITVESQKWFLRVCWIRLSVAVSTDAVASSSTRTLLFFSSTRPRQTSCLCPTLQFSPFSDTASPQFKLNNQVE